MSNIFNEEEVKVISCVIHDTLYVPRTRNKSLRKYKEQLENINNRLSENSKINDSLLTKWEEERKFAEEWNMGLPTEPAFIKSEFFKDELVIIESVLEELKLEYPTDDLLSTYIGENVDCIHYILQKISKNIRE